MASSHMFRVTGACDGADCINLGVTYTSELLQSVIFMLACFLLFLPTSENMIQDCMLIWSCHQMFEKVQCRNGL